MSEIIYWNRIVILARYWIQPFVWVICDKDAILILHLVYLLIELTQAIQKLLDGRKINGTRQNAKLFELKSKTKNVCAPSSVCTLSYFFSKLQPIVSNYQ